MSRIEKLVNKVESSLNYLIINHKNSISYIDKDEWNKMTIFLSKILFSLQDSNPGCELNKLFKMVLPENSNEILTTNRQIANGKQVSIDKLTTSINRLLNKKKITEFSFSKSEVDDIVLILYYIYKNMPHRIKTNEDLMLKIEELYNTSTNFLKKYITKTQHDNKEDFSYNYYNEKSIKNNKSKDKKKDNLDEEYKNDYGIPIEMLILVKIFQNVKKIKFKLSEYLIENPDYLHSIIFILLNLPWIFPHTIELEINFSLVNLYKDLNEIYLNKLSSIAHRNKANIRTTLYDTGYNTKRKFNFANSSRISIDSKDSSNNNESGNEDNEEDDEQNKKEDKKEIEEENDDIDDDDDYLNFSLLTKGDKKNKIEEVRKYSDILVKYSAIFSNIIVYSYFAVAIKNLSILKLIIPDYYPREIVKFLNFKKIDVFNYNFISMITNVNKLVQFTCDFNCLDFQTFESLLGFIFNNENLKILQLSFFPPEELFSPQMLLKILQSSGFNLKALFPKNKRNALSDKANDDIDILIINKLLLPFEENMTHFFALIEKKFKLDELTLLFDLPTIIINNSSYSMVLIKFFFNIFLFLQNNTGQYELENLSILAEYFNFDNRKYPIISEFLEKMNLYQNKECSLKKLTFNAKILNISNLYTIIPCNLTHLSIGELNDESFINIVNYLTSIEYNKISQLENLNLSLANSIITYDFVKETIENLFINYPKTLKIITFTSYLNLRDEDLIDFIQLVKYNSLESIEFNLKKFEFSETFNYEKNNFITVAASKKEIIIDGCYYVLKNEELTDKILNIMINLSKKSSEFMDFNIYRLLELYLGNMAKKKFKVFSKNIIEKGKEFTSAN